MKATFSITNNTGISRPFNFDPCTPAGAVTACSAPSAVFVVTGTTLNFDVTYVTGAPGAGTVTVRISGGGDNGWINVTVSAGSGVAVTPDAGTAPSRTANTSGYVEAFTVQNTSGTSKTFSFTCVGMGGVGCGTTPGNVTLAAGAQTTVNMPYGVGDPGAGSLYLTAIGPSASDGGKYSVSINGVTVTPTAGTAPTRTANTAGHSEVFTVKNAASTSKTYTFSCNGVGGVTCGTVPASVTLNGGAQTNVSMPYSVGAPGMGTLSFMASGPGGSATGNYGVPIESYGVAVTPDGATATTRTPNTGGHSESFTVQNTGSANNTFTFTCSGATGVTCGTVPAPVTLGGGAQTTVSMPYSVGAAGTGTLSFTAAGTNASDGGSYTVPIISYGVTVTPDGSITPSHPQNTTGYSETFTVRNTGSSSNTFTFSCTGAGGVSCGTAPAPVSLAPNGGQTNLSMPYSLGLPGTGTLTLTATGTGTSDAGSYSIPISVTLSSVGTDGRFVKDGRFLLQETANAYDAGRFAQVTNARGNVTNYQFGGNANNAFLIKVTQTRDATGTMDLVTEITYDTDGLVASIKDAGGGFTYFTYDLYGRLRQVKNSAGTVVKAYGYTYSRTSGNGWTFQVGSPNAIVDSVFMQAPPVTRAVVTMQYLDGLGRPIQKAVEDGANYHVAATQYDAMGRPWRAWKPYTRSVAGYDVNFAANAASFHTAYHGTTATPYVETLYRLDALGRVAKVIAEHLGTPAFMLTGYDVDATARQEITQVTDESGNKTRRYVDVFGNEVTNVLGYGAAEATTTRYQYNVLGQRTQATDPRSLITTYTLDTRGLLRSSTSPDAGTVSAKYDQNGQRRFSQDANQTAAGEVAFMNYDFAGRQLTAGVGPGSITGVDPFVTNAVETAQNNWLVVRGWDAKPSTGTYPWSLFSAQIAAAPALTNTGGRLAAIASKSGLAWQVTLFSYDADGQVANRYVYTQASDGNSVLTALNTTVTYVRDLRGSQIERHLMVGTRGFYQWYDYDSRGLLIKAYANTTTSKPPADVVDSYRPGGEPQDFQFQGGPLVPIRYTVRGQTAQIGDPSSTLYPFSARYVYNANGTISQAEFYNSGVSAAQKRYRYDFPSYDALNRLKTADYTGWNGTTWAPTLAHDVLNMMYDVDGNITALQRYRETATLIDNLTYNYPSVSNRLSSVTDAAGASAESWDAEAGSFTYDPNGNIITAPAPYSIASVTYSYQNLPVSLRQGDTTTSYRYDDSGERISKQVGANDAEFYVRDGAITLAVFTLDASGTPQSWHFNIIWDKRPIGRQPGTGPRSYYYFDMLGSIRSVTQTASVVESYDFDPWGLPMPGRIFGSGTKEGFGGKELDGESELSYFGARYYMPALGRWAAVDPALDGMLAWSPYNYVFNNPVLHTDPDGRQVDVKATNAYWEQVAIEGHQRGGLGGWLQAAGATIASTVVEFGGLNLMDRGTDDIADGHVVRGLAKTALGVASLMPLPVPRGAGAAGSRTGQVVNAAEEGVNALKQGAVEGAENVSRLAPDAAQASRGGRRPVQLGQEGEAAVRATNDIGPKQAIQVGERTRIPDGIHLGRGVVTEVKNVAKLSFTRQLRDFASFARSKGLRFDIWVRPGTELSSSVRQAVRESGGWIRICTIGKAGCP